MMFLFFFDKLAILLIFQAGHWHSSVYTMAELQVFYF